MGQGLVQGGTKLPKPAGMRDLSRGHDTQQQQQQHRGGADRYWVWWCVYAQRTAAAVWGSPVVAWAALGRLLDAGSGCLLQEQHHCCCWCTLQTATCPCRAAWQEGPWACTCSCMCGSCSVSTQAQHCHLWIPFLSPSAWEKAEPSARAMSSTVWWSSIQVSPSAST